MNFWPTNNKIRTKPVVAAKVPLREPLYVVKFRGAVWNNFYFSQHFRWQAVQLPDATPYRRDRAEMVQNRLHTLGFDNVLELFVSDSQPMDTRLFEYLEAQQRRRQQLDDIPF